MRRVIRTFISFANRLGPGRCQVITQTSADQLLMGTMEMRFCEGWLKCDCFVCEKFYVVCDKQPLWISPEYVTSLMCFPITSISYHYQTQILVCWEIHSIQHKSIVKSQYALPWRHNDHDGVSNHQPHGCLFNRLFRRRSKKTSKFRVTGL